MTFLMRAYGGLSIMCPDDWLAGLLESRVKVLQIIKARKPMLISLLIYSTPTNRKAG